MTSVIPCGYPSKTTYPKRPSCEHGEMAANGDKWVCREKSRARNRRDYWADPIGRAARIDQARRATRISRIERDLVAYREGIDEA